MTSNPFFFQTRTIGANSPIALWQTESIYKVENGVVHLFVVFPQEEVQSRLYINTFNKDEIFCNVEQQGGISLLAVGQGETSIQEINEQRLFEQIQANPLDPDTIRWNDYFERYYHKIVKLSGAEPSKFECNAAFLKQVHGNFLNWAYHFQKQWNDQDAKILSDKHHLNQEHYENALFEFSEILHPSGHFKLKKVSSSSYKDADSRFSILNNALNAIGKNQGISFSFPAKSSAEFAAPLVSPFAAPLAAPLVAPRLDASSDPDEEAPKINRHLPMSSAIEEICRLSKIRYRKISLRQNWWKEGSSSILGFVRELPEQDEKQEPKIESPVALILDHKGQYKLHFFNGSEAELADKQSVEQLMNYGYVFYRPFPDTHLNLKKISSWFRKELRADAFTSVLNGVLGAAISTTIPLVIAKIFDSVIPNAEVDQLAKFCVILLTVAGSNAIFSFVQSVAVLRLENKWDIHLNSALWDRLLRLPVHFFKRYTVADLSERAGTITAIHQTVGTAALTAVFTALNTLFNFLILFHYHKSLAFSAVIILVITFLFYGISLKWSLFWLRQQVSLDGKISGTVFQILDGLSKIKVAAAEKRGFAVWSKEYAESIKILKKSRKIQWAVATYNSALLVLGNWLIYWIADSYIHFNASLTLGQFIAFSAAFTLFIKGSISLCNPLFELLKVIPLWERIQPILQETPEISITKTLPKELQGKIEVDHVSFSYGGDQLALDDISFSIDSGEFVALVGTSGSGKSTLLRILLGFESPGKGSIYYDDQDLKYVDVSAIRRNIGVVLQNGRLLSGDIFTNIVGNLPLSMTDAWQAARWAGLEEDILNMPMGMHTLVGEGSSALSGGQRQRIMIARALIRRPKIIFFDEATSALDNLSQKIVQQSLDGLGITRMVIAHRLSTIRNANKILVFSKGQIVQQGTYETLFKQEGVFQDLVRRQLS